MKRFIEGEKIEVAIYGGSFNPIHNDHIRIAKEVLNHLNFVQQIWFLPCYKSLYNKELLDGNERCRMIQLAIDEVEDSRLRLCDYEIVNQFNGSTHQFCRMFLEDKEYKDTYKFRFLMGADNAQKIITWDKSDELLKLIDLIVVSRPGVRLEPSWFMYSKRHIFLQLLDSNLPLISSSTIRRDIRDFREDNVRSMVPLSVSDYIYSNQFYR